MFHKNLTSLNRVRQNILDNEEKIFNLLNKKLCKEKFCSLKKNIFLHVYHSKD